MNERPEGSRLFVSRADVRSGLTRRPTWDEYFIAIACVAATRSTCSRLAVGAVVVKDRRIQSTGYNGTPPGKAHCEHTEDTPCEIAIHAEENALTWANEARGGTLYSTHAPCGDCAALIQMDEIERVVYKDKYRSLSGIISLKLAGIEVVQL